MANNGDVEFIMMGWIISIMLSETMQVLS